MLTDKNTLQAPGRSRLSIEPVLLVDTREKEPLIFSQLRSELGSLVTGDYSIKGAEHLFAIERKTISDLVACCIGENRERFERELLRLRGYRFRRVVLIGSREEILSGSYRSAIKPQAVMASLGAWEVRFDLPVVFTPTPALAAAQIKRWAYWFAREVILSSTRLERAGKELSKP